ncbi:MAG: mechanosensitive ion channel family protein [Cyclobacteriaceae bacterium]
MNWIEQNWSIETEVQLKLFFSFLVIFGLWLIRYFLISLLFKRVVDPKERYYWRNGIRNAQYILVILIIGAIWIDRIGSVATFLGLVTAGLAIALQDPIVNLAGWLFIILRRPFEVGDRIEVGGYAGDVIDIRFFQFTLNEINNWVDADQSTGRIIHIPNGKVFKEPQASYTQGFSHIWNEINVTVTFESDWQKAKELLNNIVKEHAEHLTKAAKKRLIEASKKFMIFYKNLTPTVYTEVKENGVQISMRYLVLPRRRRLSEHKIWEDVLKSFAEHDDIHFAYPTQRVYFRPQEGKESVRGPGSNS